MNSTRVSRDREPRLNGVKTGLDGGGVDHAAMVDAVFGFSPKPSASVCCFFAHFPIRLLRVAYFGSGT
jgi:hypothetical protein